MKIIISGTLPDGEFLLTCTGAAFGSNGCGSLLQVNRNDIKVNDLTEVGGGTMYTMCCPKCNTTSKIPYDQIPPNIIRKLNGWG